MRNDNFDWKAGLADLFGGTVNQQTLEEAAEIMVSIGDASYHIECLAMFENGILAARRGDRSVIECINKSGYRVLTNEDAIKLLSDFHEIYLAEYKRTNLL